MLDARFFRRPAEFPRQIEDVSHQRAAADFVVGDLGVFAVFGAQNAQTLAVRLVRRIVEIAKHDVAY